MKVKELMNYLKLLDKNKEIVMHEFGEGYYDIQIMVARDESMYTIENGEEVDGEEIE